ncbi:D-Ala-D-Ala carboxypeptidase family metallohydrolase [bacterium]|nr:D-Ala-D-Ala carboxypeptidase family metallohydrolase [bacterium]
MRLSINFKRSEFACPCGCGFDTVDHELIEELEEVRRYFGTPITITSGCRCQEHNASIDGAAPNSQHKRGRAADFVVKGVDSGAVADYCETIGIPGVGRYNGRTHIDTKSGKVRRW